MATYRPLVNLGGVVAELPAADTLGGVSGTPAGYTTTATTAGTTTLTASSTYLQFFTGSTTQTITLPVASTLTLGQQFRITNNSTGTLTVNSSGGNLVLTVPPATVAIITCILISGTSAASWSANYTGEATVYAAAAIALVAAGVGTLTSYTANYRVKLIGKTAHLQIYISITNNGTGSSYLNITIPISSRSSGTANWRQTVVGRNITTGKFLTGAINDNSTTLLIQDYTGAYPCATGDELVINCVYEIA